MQGVQRLLDDSELERAGSSRTPGGAENGRRALGAAFVGRGRGENATLRDCLGPVLT